MSIFENANFQVVHLSQINLYLYNKYIYLSKKCIELMNCKYVVFYVNEETKQLAIKKCNRNNRYSHTLQRRYGGEDVINLCKSLFGELKQVEGKYYDDEKAIIFG